MGTTYTATVDATDSIVISRDGVWAGTGRIRYARWGAHADQQWRVEVVDCPADLGEDVYVAIEDAIEDEMAGWDGVTPGRITVTVTVEEEE